MVYEISSKRVRLLYERKHSNLSGKTLSGESDKNFLKSDENFRPKISPDKVSPDKIIKICLNDFFSLLGSFVLQLKTLLLLLGETLRQAKVTNFSISDENFARRIVSPDENFARQSLAR